MRLCTETITVFHNQLNPETGDTELVPVTIPEASWFDETVAEIDLSGGLKAASKVVIRIPGTADYGIRHGDLVIKGAGEGKTLADLKKTKDRVVTVLAITDNRRAPNAPHWKVVGA